MTEDRDIANLPLGQAVPAAGSVSGIPLHLSAMKILFYCTALQCLCLTVFCLALVRSCVHVDSRCSELHSL